MRALILAMALACAPAAAWAQASDETGAPEAVVTAAQDGTTVDVVVGAKVIVELEVNPSTGAHWDVAQKPEFLSDATTTIVSPSLPAGQRPRLGAPKTARIEFTVNGSGSGELVLERRGPGADAPTQATFRITVTAP